MFVDKARSLYRRSALEVQHLPDWNTSWWKGLLEANTLAYYKPNVFIINY
jgi:hypothetical protein